LALEQENKNLYLVAFEILEWFLALKGELEIIMLSGTSQSHKGKYLIFSLICGSQGKSKQSIKQNN
jgi:hypothetical protein